MKKAISTCTSLFFMAGSLAGCGVQMGSLGAKSVATGSAGGENAENVNTHLVHCEIPFGTMAVNEDHTNPWYGYMVGRFGVQSTVPVLRLLAQQSNCFVVVERGTGMNSVTRERRLQQSGELRQDSNFDKGQMVAADYTVTPTLVYKQKNVGGAGMMLGAFIPFGTLIGAAVSGLSYKDSQSLLTLVDNRSGVQVSVAEGSSKGMDVGGVLGMLDISSGGAGGLGAYTRTAEGKLIVASMTDAYNHLVSAARNYKPQQATGPKGVGTGGALKIQ